MHYSTHPVDFINDWMVTYDPRLQPSLIPFILFPKQAEYIDWLYARYIKKEDGLVEKSRDMGVTWLCCAFAVWMWLFVRGSSVSFGSRKEDLVDQIGNPDSIFEKMRMILDNLPYEFLPPGFSLKSHATHMKILNPATGSNIKGEAGDNIGRGGRSSLYFKDEAQPYHSMILTKSGFIKMQDVSIGDVLVGPNGKDRKIVNINDCGTHPVYRVHLGDGTSVEASHNHLWTVKRHGAKRKKTIRTHEIAEKFFNESPGGQRHYLYRIEACQPVTFADINRPKLDPYIVGAMLGDGGMTASAGTPRITSADSFILSEFHRLLPDGVMLRHDSRYSYRLVGGIGKGRSPRGRNNIIKTMLIDAGIYGKGAASKSIPNAYKMASVSDRLSLLQGLMDTDGSASGGVASFHSCSKQLADDVRFLVWSLGGTCTHNVKPDKRGYLDMHVLHIALPSGMIPFRLPRKIAALRTRKNTIDRTIVGIEYIGNQPVRCISVDSEDGLYITDNFITTHNSAFYMQPERIEAALSMNSDVKIDVSTPNGNGNPFYRKRHGGKIPVFTFHWKDDPRKDAKWYEKQKATLDPVILAQEVEIDYNASVGNVLIDSELVRDAMGNRGSDVFGDRPNDAPLVLGVDVARFGDDRTVLVCRQGREVHWYEVYTKLDTMQTAGVVQRAMREQAFDAVFVDVVGLGAGVFDLLNEKYPNVYAVNGGNNANESDRYYNHRAEQWGRIRQWLKDRPVILPNDPDLLTDLCSLQYSFNASGQLVLEKKEDAKKRGVKSPDIGDALGLTFAQYVAKAEDFQQYDNYNDTRDSRTGY